MAVGYLQLDLKADTMERTRRNWQKIQLWSSGSAFDISSHVDGTTIIAPGQILSVRPGSIQSQQLGILTTQGDLMTFGSTHMRLGIGAVGEFLKVGTNGMPIWGAGGGGGGTATYALAAGTATVALTSLASGTATYALTAGTATYALTSGSSITSGTATYALTSGSAGTSTYAISSGTSTESLHAETATYALTSGTSTNSLYATSAGTATEALHAGTATYSQYLSPGFYFSVPTGMAVAGNPNNGAGTTTLSLTTQTLSIPGGLSVTGNLTANNYSGTSSGTNTGDQINATIGTSPPASTSVLWLDSNSGKLFSWYIAEWIEVGAWDGLISYPYAAKSAAYPATASDWLINCTSGTFTVTLPTAVGATGKSYKVKNSGTGTITVATTGGQTIDGEATQTLIQYDCIEVVSDGANWIIT